MYTQTFVSQPVTTTYVQPAPMLYNPPMTTTTYVQPAPTMTYVSQPQTTTTYVNPYGQTTTYVNNPVCH